MKIRIIRKNKKMLQEAAKGPSDLPQNYYVRVIARKGEDYEITYKEKYPGKEKITGALSITKLESDQCANKVFAVKNAAATEGWGPMLYDIAMELVFLHEKGGLTSDRLMVSGDAKGIWDFYDEKRDDVEKTQMDIHDSTLRFVYDRAGVPKDKQPQKLTPNDPSDDCEQDSSIFWAIGKGDWKTNSSDDQFNSAAADPEASKGWSEQSISRVYKKNNSEIIDKLILNQQFKLEVL